MVILSIRQSNFVSKLTFEFLLSLLYCISELYIFMSKNYKSSLMSTLYNISKCMYFNILTIAYFIYNCNEILILL